MVSDRELWLEKEMHLTHRYIQYLRDECIKPGTTVLEFLEWKENLSDASELDTVALSAIASLRSELATKDRYIQYLLDNGFNPAVSLSEWVRLSQVVEGIGGAKVAQFLKSRGWFFDDFAKQKRAQHISCDTTSVLVPVGDRTWESLKICPVDTILRISRAFRVTADAAIALIEDKK
jgi:hypothetical protein